MAAGEAGIVQLLIGVSGIYAAFLYYGSLQEDVLTFKNAETGEVFKYAWFLQVVEACANVVLGVACVFLFEGGYRPGVPQKPYAISGALQVSAKYFTAAAMIYGVSFPVAMLAKSSKMIPVMVGQLLLGKAKYTMRAYVHVIAIVMGTVLVSSGKSSKPGAPSSSLGLFCLAASLACDGAVAGTQKGLKASLKEAKLEEKSFEMQAYTNGYMMVTAIFFTLAFGEFGPALAFLGNNPAIGTAIAKFGVCSAIGQAFIFFTISKFDPLIATTVTTTRKVFSVLLSIFTKGHSLSGMGMVGIACAFGGIFGELEEKYTEGKEKQKKTENVADSHVKHYGGLSGGANHKAS